MKRLSLKARLTLLYTGLMIVLFVIISALLFSLGSQAILTDTRSLLEERVSSSLPPRSAGVRFRSAAGGGRRLSLGL